MKYKVGDKVRIKSLGWYDENKDVYGYIECGKSSMNFETSQLCGKIVTISRINDVTGTYKIEEDNGLFFWTDEMIECKVEEENKFGTASNPIEPKSNANCLTLERVDALATKIDKELPSWNQNVWELPNGYQFTDENGNIINATKIVLEKKEYPKTYAECCKVLQYGEILKIYPPSNADVPEYDVLGLFDSLEALRKLLICRDAYWKIAGEEMGLGKPWEPDWENQEPKYCIFFSYNSVEFDDYNHMHHFLAFPTPKMRDAFYENFKSEIERCKELL